MSSNTTQKRQRCATTLQGLAQSHREDADARHESSPRAPLLTNYLTKAELCRELSIDPRTLSRWRLQRKGPPAVRIAGRLLFHREAVLAWIESHQERAA